MDQSVSPTTFLFIRHAQTVWNKEQRHAGSTEVPLSDQAGHQIAKLTRKIGKAEVKITALYSSPLSRCRFTIAPLSRELHLPVTISDNLKERGLGDWEGRSPVDLAPLHPGYHFPDSAYTGEFRIPHAEPLEELEQRIRAFLNEVHDQHPGEQVAICTHSGVIWTIHHRIATNPPDRFIWPGNCSITTIVSEQNHFKLTAYEEI
ncbi:phosphoglycerate mutase family protein [Patescibacteria group bacterium]|nr:phosphoglycerate mutase family protein [Patescibacteria group bacterium]